MDDPAIPDVPPVEGRARPTQRRPLWASMGAWPRVTAFGILVGLVCGMGIGLALAGPRSIGATSGATVAASSAEFCSIMTRAIATPVTRDAPDTTAQELAGYGASVAPWPQPSIAAMAGIYSTLIVEISALGITDSDAVDDLLTGLTMKRDQLRADPSIWFSADRQQIARQTQPTRLIGNAMFRLVDQGLIPSNGSCAALCPSATPASKGWTLLLYPFSVNDLRPDAPISGPVGDMIEPRELGSRSC